MRKITVPSSFTIIHRSVLEDQTVYQKESRFRVMKEQRHPEMGKEYPRTDQILYFSTILFFAIWIIDSFLFRFSTAFARYVPDVLRVVLFLCLEAVAVVLGYSSHESLFSNKHEEFKLIKTGVFAWVRHPLYLSILLAYLGFIFGAMSLVSFVPRFVSIDRQDIDF